MLAAVLVALACSDDKRDFAARDTGAMPAEEADNTGRNLRDRDENTVTPIDQSNTEQDVDLIQRIRSGITSIDSMSLQARNVKVISQDGVVTLRGPVESEREKASIEMLARNAGATRIDNQLEIDQDAVPSQEN
jgi:osmotically-inducible protein OsmY